MKYSRNSLFSYLIRLFLVFGVVAGSLGLVSGAVCPAGSEKINSDPNVLICKDTNTNLLSISSLDSNGNPISTPTSESLEAAFRQYSGNTPEQRELLLESGAADSTSTIALSVLNADNSRLGGQLQGLDVNSLLLVEQQASGTGDAEFARVTTSRVVSAVGSLELNPITQKAQIQNVLRVSNSPEVHAAALVSIESATSCVGSSLPNCIPYASAEQTLRDVCADYQDRCGEALFTMNVPVADELILRSMEGEGALEISDELSDDFATRFLTSRSLSDEDYKKVLDAINNGGCEEDEYFCRLGSIFSERQSGSDFYRESIEKQINAFRNADENFKNQEISDTFGNNFDFEFSFDGSGSFVCGNSDTLNECQIRAKNVCGDDYECMATAQLELSNYVNQALLENTIRQTFSTNVNLQNFDCDGFSTLDCKQTFLDTCRDQSGVSNSQCNAAASAFDSVYKKETVDTSSIYDVLTLFLKPDARAVKGLKLFGIEADYASLPAFLRDEFSSQICYAKINGYLDKEIQQGGGVTSYTITNTSNEIQVVADVRGQRTRVTPDDKTSVTLSYFIRAPHDSGIKYIVAMSFRDDGRVKKIALTDTIRVSKNGKRNDFQTIDIPLNSTGEVDENSFKIGLLAVRDSGSVYTNLITPMILVTAGDAIFDLGSSSGNDAGNSASRTSSNDNGGLDSDGLLSLMN